MNQKDHRMSRFLKWLKRIAIVLIFLLAIGYAWLWHILGTSSVTTHGSVNLNTGNIDFPTERTRVWSARSTLTDSILLYWSQREIKDWAKDGKVTIPRILIGKLAVGRDIAFVNEYLQERQPRGTVGSTGPFHSTGDYDFTLAGLSLLLYSFGDNPDVLYPETVDHIVDVLMTQEGGKPKVFTPRVLGLPLRDTENHILMTEGSRYLKNRWKALHGNREPKYDNATNGLEDYLLEYLGEIERAGYHEYNSRPYQGYTLTALMNIEAFSAPPVRTVARSLLDRTNWEYALSSMTFRRFPPFRRQPRRAKDTDLDGDYITDMMKTWMSLGGVDDLYVRAGAHQALWVCMIPYRLPDAVAEWVMQKPSDYFIQMGHGNDGSPEIYSGGPGYLISSGGVQNDRFEQGVRDVHRNAGGLHRSRKQERQAPEHAGKHPSQTDERQCLLAENRGRFASSHPVK
ncbi:MAG: hypothetical protein IID30_07000, partial [Planctomycetes bacterium]|nr:hypothetical protein [Planctomycetota bacterium]